MILHCEHCGVAEATHQRNGYSTCDNCVSEPEEFPMPLHWDYETPSGLLLDDEEGEE